MPSRNIAVYAMISMVCFACGDDASEPSGDTTEQSDIVDTAVEAGQFDTLVAAVQAAELEATLRGTGPFTVFAPTDDAFAALPAGTVDTLLLPENKATLQSVLTYHVVAGRLLASDVVSRSTVDTVQGDSLPISVSGSEVRVGDAKVVATDVEASNGVIHVIDTVLVPD